MFVLSRFLLSKSVLGFSWQFVVVAVKIVEAMLTVTLDINDILDLVPGTLSWGQHLGHHGAAGPCELLLVGRHVHKQHRTWF